MEIDNLILDKENMNYNGYDIIIAYINSRCYNNIQENIKEKIMPYLNKNRILYRERIYKIEEMNKKSPNIKIKIRINKLLSLILL